MDLSGRPAADGGAAVQENFHEANDPRVMDFDSRITNCADGHWQGQTLQQREIHMDVEPLGLAIGETIGNDLESFAYHRDVAAPSSDRSRADCWNIFRCAGTGRTFHIA